MKKYFCVQLKRILRLLPAVFCVVAILFGSLAAVYGVMLQMNSESEDRMKFQVGMVGTAGEMYLELGLAALESLDSTRFAIEISPMMEEEAERALNRGEIAAYVVFPEGFMDAAMSGTLMPLKFVSTVGATSIVSLVKDEITSVVDDILVETQKGIYGAAGAMREQGYKAGPLIDDISIEYIEFVLARSKLYSVTELGISDGLGLDGYLLCGLSVLFALLICLPFATLFVKQDLALGRMLEAKRNSVSAQVGSEFLAFFLAMAALFSIILAVILSTGLLSSYELDWRAVLCAVPALLAVVTFSFLLFEIAKDLISGILLHFFLSLALCFVSGCMYPATFFPETVQKLSGWLPTGLARIQLSGCLTGSVTLTGTFALLGYSLLFFLTAAGVRKYRIRRIRG